MAGIGVQQAMIHSRARMFLRSLKTRSFYTMEATLAEDSIANPCVATALRRRFKLGRMIEWCEGRQMWPQACYDYANIHCQDKLYSYIVTCPTHSIMFDSMFLATRFLPRGRYLKRSEGKQLYLYLDGQWLCQKEEGTSPQSVMEKMARHDLIVKAPPNWSMPTEIQLSDVEEDSNWLCTYDCSLEKERSLLSPREHLPESRELEGLGEDGYSDMEPPVGFCIGADTLELAGEGWEERNGKL
jgi:hypothetical protein